jgi:flagellar FliL protein
VKGKLKIVLPLALLLVLGGLYKVVLAKPPEKAEPKVHGHVYVLPKEFMLNLADGHFAKLNVALVLHEALPAAHGGATPPEGFGPLEQEAVVRDVITDTVSGASSSQLVSRKGRQKLKKRVLKRLGKETDVKVNDVLFTDIAVQ